MVRVPAGDEPSPISGSEAPKTAKIPFFYGWVVVAVAFVDGFIAVGFYAYSRGMYLPSLAEALSGGEVLYISLAFAIAQGVGALSAPFIGVALDSLSPRRFMMLGVCLVTAGYLLLSQVTALWQFYLVLAFGFGFGMISMSGFTTSKLIVNWFDRRRGMALAISGVGMSVSGIVMPFVATWLIESYGWRNAYLAFGVLTLAFIAPLIVLLVKDNPEEIGQAPDGDPLPPEEIEARARAEAEPKPSLGEVAGATARQFAENLRGGFLNTPSFWSIVLIFSVMSCVYSAVMLHLYKHLTEEIALTSYEAASVLSLTAALAAVGKIVFGWLADLAGQRLAIWGCLGSQLAGVLIFGYAPDYRVALLGGAVYGLGYSGMVPLRNYATASAFGRKAFASAAGLMRPFMLPIQLSASPIAAFVYDTTGSYRLAFEIMAGFILVASLGPFFLRGAKGEPAETRRAPSVAE